MTSERVAQNARLFDAVAPSYDALGFLAQAARFLAEQVPAGPGRRILEVGSGTGVVALDLARRGAVVTGLDISPGMVRRAQDKARGLPGVQFQVGDGRALPFPGGSFDVVVSAATLFFMPDMEAALREWRRVLLPGGAVVFSSFGRGLLGPLPGLWREDLAACGLKPGSPPLGRLPSVEAARDLLSAAGFVEVEASLTELAYPLASPAARWADISAGLEGAPLAGFTAADREALRERHLARLAERSWPLRVPLPVIVARGLRPQV